MNAKQNVFIFPCGSEIGLELNRALSYSTYFHSIGGSSVDDHGRFAFSDYVGGLPYIDDSAFLPELQRLIRERFVRYLFPAHDSALVLFAQWADGQALEGAYVVTSPLPTCLTTRSKRATYELFDGIVPTPRLYESPESVEHFPVFLKPDVGQGSRGTQKVCNREEMLFFLGRDRSLLILEYLPGNEYTIDCFTDRTGRLRFVGGRTRRRITNGISASAVKTENPVFEQLAERINARLKFRGLWFFQLKARADGELVLMEISPRAAGTSGFHRNVGVNLPLLSLFDAMGHDVQITENAYSLEMDRAFVNRCQIDFAFSDVYIDLDDTLVIDGRTNHLLVGLLYKWKAEARRIHLLTRHAARHAEHVSMCLARNWLDSRLFDFIHDVPQGAKKSEFILTRTAILIDDSHSERQEIANAVQIPVFDVNQAIEIFQ